MAFSFLVMIIKDEHKSGWRSLLDWKLRHNNESLASVCSAVSQLAGLRPEVAGRKHERRIMCLFVEFQMSQRLQLFQVAKTVS